MSLFHVYYGHLWVFLFCLRCVICYSPSSLILMELCLFCLGVTSGSTREAIPGSAFMGCSASSVQWVYSAVLFQVEGALRINWQVEGSVLKVIEWPWDQMSDRHGFPSCNMTFSFDWVRSLTGVIEDRVSFCAGFAFLLLGRFGTSEILQCKESNFSYNIIIISKTDTELSHMKKAHAAAFWVNCLPSFLFQEVIQKGLLENQSQMLQVP